MAKKEGMSARGADAGTIEGEAIATTSAEGANGDARRSAGKPGKAATKVVTITDLGNHLAATFDIPKSHAKIFLDETMALIVRQLRRGAKVRLSGLGVIQIKKRAARKARNPNTGAEVKVKAGKRVAFSASQSLKDKL